MQSFFFSLSLQAKLCKVSNLTHWITVTRKSLWRKKVLGKGVKHEKVSVYSSRKKWSRKDPKQLLSRGPYRLSGNLTGCWRTTYTCRHRVWGRGFFGKKVGNKSFRKRGFFASFSQFLENLASAPSYNLMMTEEEGKIRNTEKVTFSFAVACLLCWTSCQSILSSCIITCR